MRVEIEISDGMLASYASAPGVQQELSRAATLVLMAAQERDQRKNVIIGRGIDPAAVRASIELTDKRNAEFEATFGTRKP